MKAKHISKGVVSLILTVLLIISMATVGIISVSSAKVDVAESGASEMEVYFTKPSNWGSVKLHYWGGSSESSWPGVDMAYKYTNDYSEAVYYKTVPANTTGIIFNNGSGTQSADLNVAGKQVVAYYWDGSAAVSWDTIPDPSGSGSSATETPTAAPITGEKTRLAIADDTDKRWLGNDDARFKVVINNAATAMTKSVDVASGLTIWYADVAKINGGTAIKFQRCSAINTATVWNTWTTSYVANNPLYKIQNDGEENTKVSPASMLEIPDGSVTNFGYGIWVDTKGNADTKDFVKIYANDFVKDSTYDLYLPSYTDWSQLKVYTNFPTLTIDGKTVTKGQVNTLNLSSTTTEKTVNISFKRNTAGSTHNDKLHIVRSGASALLLTTANDLYAGLAAAYGANSDGSANYDGVAAYKSQYVGGKGKYVCYDKDGNKLNTDDGLKKINGRGNSTFEASMRLYGKYAMNVTMNEKAQLIEGCAASKKYSLLANNADESLLRNATVYGIADEVGMPYTPNTRLVDLYDNGNYLGAYVLTEKVEYSKNTLIPDAKSSDKLNEDILAAGKNIDYDALVQKTGTYKAASGTTYTYQYSVASESNKTYEFDGSTVTIGEGEEAETYTLDETLMKKYDFLLEHEIETRYSVEGTWFRSNRTGQAIVPKYPEFATKKQAEWMIEQYDALEDAVYDADYTRFTQVAKAETFADVYLIQELTMNLDAGATSYYILGGKTYPQLVAAPLWDYDWAAGQYNGSKLTVSGSVDVADYTKAFVKNKSVKIDSSDGRTQSIYNLQAKLCQQNGFWSLCKTRWTNKFIPVLNSYLGSSGTLLSAKLPEYRAAAEMNNARWSVLDANYSGAHSSDPAAATWGTRSTYAYRNGSNDFGVGKYYPTKEGTKKYDNTVYYLNDWLTARKNTMSTTMGLYDTSLIETEAPTQAPTDPPTQAPTDPPTQAPTDAPTDAPTTAPTGTYLLGDTDGDGKVTVLDATAIQRILVDYAVKDLANAKIRGNVDGDNVLGILDATAIQRFIAGYDNKYGIESTKSY